jgi:hypothetical protein
VEVRLKDALRVCPGKWFRVFGKCRFKEERLMMILLGVNKTSRTSIQTMNLGWILAVGAIDHPDLEAQIFEDEGIRYIQSWK